jgi:hypothetical protein
MANLDFFVWTFLILIPKKNSLLKFPNIQHRFESVSSFKSKCTKFNSIDVSCIYMCAYWHKHHYLSKRKKKGGMNRKQIEIYIKLYIERLK